MKKCQAPACRRLYILCCLHFVVAGKRSDCGRRREQDDLHLSIVVVEVEYCNAGAISEV